MFEVGSRVVTDCLVGAPQWNDIPGTVTRYSGSLVGVQLDIPVHGNHFYFFTEQQLRSLGEIIPEEPIDDKEVQQVWY